MDSRATRHMTPQREFFVKFHPWDGIVEFRNSGESPVLGRGEFYSRRASPDSTNFRWEFHTIPVVPSQELAFHHLAGKAWHEMFPLS